MTTHDHSPPIVPRLWLLALVPAVLSVAAMVFWRTAGYQLVVLDEAVAATCAVICLVALARNPAVGRIVWLLVVAFAVSIIGDLFMKNGSESAFIAGVGCFLIAHICYLVYALRKGQPRWPVIAIVALPFLVAYAIWFLPSEALRESVPLAIAVLIYLLASCATLGAALCMGNRTIARVIFAVGIASLVISDLAIAARDFVGNPGADRWVMPLYFLCHVLLALSVTLEPTSFGDPAVNGPARYLADSDGWSSPVSSP